MNHAIRSAKRNFHVMAKPAGPLCNIECRYCFYLPKKALFAENPSMRMSEAVLENFTRQYIRSQPPGTPEVDFAWQGGEPTLMGVDFFHKAVKYQRRYKRPGMAVTNSLQTNALLLDDEWGAFLCDHNFLVGISIDGPDWLHDRFRRDKTGAGTFARTMAGLDVLRKHGVEYNTLTCVHAGNSRYPVRVYDFLKEIGSVFLQFIPVVESSPDGRAVSRRSVAPEKYGDFLRAVFGRWLEKEDVGRVFVRDFDAFLGLVMGLSSPLCTHARTCGRCAVIEHNGEMFGCDHFVDSRHRIGNVLDNSMPEMLDGARQTRFGVDKRDRLPQVCMDCEFRYVCNGGCPKDRIVAAPDGKPRNYLCEGYQRFFRHSIPIFQKMADCIQKGRPAREYKAMDQRGRGKAREQIANTGRNDPCPCGSGKKFKKCCL